MTVGASARQRARRLRAALTLRPLLRVQGSCMPELPDGSDVQLAAQSRVLPGDVVVALAADGRVVVHRLLGWYPGRRGWQAVTAADRSVRPDTPVPHEQILGRLALPVAAITRVRSLGRLGGWLVRELAGRLRGRGRAGGDRGEGRRR